jgi:hypothetical protein
LLVREKWVDLEMGDQVNGPDLGLNCRNTTRQISDDLGIDMTVGKSTVQCALQFHQRLTEPHRLLAHPRENCLDGRPLFWCQRKGFGQFEKVKRAWDSVQLGGQSKPGPFTAEEGFDFRIGKRLDLAIRERPIASRGCLTMTGVLVMPTLRKDSNR